MAINESFLEPATLYDWLCYLQRIHSRPVEMELGRVNQVRSALGLAPAFPLITVAGTNGKGSSCMMLEAILSRAGYRVGCYTSPHLLRYNERVRIGRQEASDAQLCHAFHLVEAARIACGVSLTYFEFGTLAAMQLFSESKVDIAILEVGLGGRLDAVNIFDTDCAVLTSVEFDHMDYLGSTREQIGFEKAGIFRGGKAAVCSDPDVPASVRAHARAIGANFLHIGEHFGYTAEASGWSYQGPGGVRPALPYPALRGTCQLLNASAVLTALDTLKHALPVTTADIRQGLLEVVWPGRFQVLPGRPLTVVDVAHNPAAARVLAANLDSLGRHSKTYAVFAMLKDKDIAGVARVLAERVDVWLVAGIDALRGATAEEVAQILRQAGIGSDAGAGEGTGKSRGGKTIHCFERPAAAYAFAHEQASRNSRGNDRICVFGSFHTVADVLQYRNTVEPA